MGQFGVNCILETLGGASYLQLAEDRLSRTGAEASRTLGLQLDPNWSEISTARHCSRLKLEVNVFMCLLLGSWAQLETLISRHLSTETQDVYTFLQGFMP